MKLSLMDEQEVRTFANKNRDLVESVILSSAATAHQGNNFFSESISAALFLDFAKSLATVLGGVVTVTKIISSAEQSFKWMQAKLKNGDYPSEETILSERILILVFEAYANRKSGVREDSLRTILDVKSQVLDHALKGLAKRNVVRKAKDGTWKYVSSTI